jgi:hypothetical protein
MTDHKKSWDVFISHASEDKETFVRPLALSLKKIGVSVWYDEFALRIGDSLSRSIDKGLVDSRFGVVVISQHFIKKQWPEYELRGLVSREIDEGRVILPIWHGVTRKQVVAFSPTLADKIAINTKGLKAEDVSIQILREVRPDLYAQHNRAELERLAASEADQTFIIGLQKYAREIITGEARELLLECCAKLRRYIMDFREILRNFEDLHNQHRKAQSNRGDNNPSILPLVKGLYRYPPLPRNYSSDYSIKEARKTAVLILERLKVDASGVQSSIELVRQAWKEADPSQTKPELHELLNDPLDLASYISKTISNASGLGDWWVREKLSAWIKALPEIEASLEGAITLLKSWAKFDPKKEGQPNDAN